MKGRTAAALLGLELLAACARPQARAPVRPETADYRYPSPARGEAAAEGRRLEKAWADVLAGKAERAEREYAKILYRRPALVPAETGLAYARLRAGRDGEALQGFASVLARQPDYLPALVGASLAAARAGQPEAAVGFQRRAVAVAPEDEPLRRRLSDLKLQVTERRMGEARAATQAGRPDLAAQHYRVALEAAPELSALRLELAELLAAGGDVPGAVAVLEAEPGGDRRVLLRLGEILERQGDHERAIAAYRRILAASPRDAEALGRARRARESLELLRMPEEYRRIPHAPRLTRADLAALLAVKVTALGRLPAGAPRVAVDISGSWARDHVLKALAYDLMEVYPNHTFQPAAAVRRGDLARALQRVLDLLNWPATPAPGVTDMSRTNLLHYAVSRVVGAGLMDLTPAGAFEAWRPVSGAEAWDVVEALVRLVGP